MSKYQVSVLVLSYNPDLSKMKATLRSVLLQKNISKQIIIADDGSKNNHFPEIEELFRQYDFKDYVMVGNEQNVGITKNFYSGLVKAEGEFFKGISPGDYLYEEDTLAKWYSFMKENKLKVSFGNAVYFHLEDDKLVINKGQNMRPRIISIYDLKKYNDKMAKLNCWVLRDFIVGAVYFAKTEYVRKYCEPLVGRVIYKEDALYRIMVLDDVRTVHYEENVMMYEYGTGVSTTSDSKWKKIMYEDEKIVEKIVSKSDRHDPFTNKLRGYFKLSKDTLPQKVMCILKCFPFAGFMEIYATILAKTGKCRASEKYDRKFMDKIRRE